MIDEHDPLYVTSARATDRSSVSQSVDNSVNKALPWFGVAIVMAAIALSASVYAVAVSRQARDTGFESQTQSLLLRDYVDKLRFELASHGIKPPDYPIELRTSP